MDNTMETALQTVGNQASKPLSLQPSGDGLAPSPEEVALLTRQYQKALDGLFEAYQFGRMLLSVRRRLEDAEDAENGERKTENGYALTGDGQTAEPLQNADLSGETARGLAREIVIGNNGNVLHEGGWNRGTGLKGWLAQFCPEINYSTAKRFLAVAEKTVAALALAEASEEPETDNRQPTTGGGAAAPAEARVRAFLAGKSQRAVLRLGGRREGAGRKAKDWAAALEASPEVAWKELAEPLERLSRLIVRERRHAALTAQDLHTLRDAIDLLHECVHADA